MIQTARKTLTTELLQRKLLPAKGLIGADWVPAISGRSFVVSDPSTSTEVQHVTEMGADDAQLAVGAAVQTFPAWKGKAMQVRFGEI